MIRDLEDLRLYVYRALTADLICFTEELEEVYKYANVGYENRHVFEVPMKVNDFTESFIGNIYIDNYHSKQILKIDDDLHFFDILMSEDEKSIRQIKMNDDEVLVKCGEKFVSNLDMEHWESMKALYHIVKAFNDKFDIGMDL